MEKKDGIKPRILVVMGVSAVGKTTIAEALVERLHWPFQEGDDLHPAANREKMRSGTPLTDEDRKPWLEKVAAWIDARRAASEPGIITCSALKKAYRKVIIGDRPGVNLLYLKADRRILEERIDKRKGHFMSPNLLESQLQTLEEPSEDERAFTVIVHGNIDETVESTLSLLRTDKP
ncbi:hypothetical protein RvY_15434 [Ramazzottius varieornatus]|uniref:Gluconokinase n=1 Tax=Ramazzottius varieornatus TaxID=947166 RepID=A0A1D1W2W9_RAMVA|nr:hypothetical protein RvY_15434 [Ramazzottius varieornatus]